MRPLDIPRDAKGVPTLGRNFSLDGSIIKIDEGATANLTVPTGATVAFFTFGDDASVMVGYGSSALDAPTASFADSTAEINPYLPMSVLGISTLQFRGLKDGSVMHVTFYNQGRTRGHTPSAAGDFYTDRSGDAYTERDGDHYVDR